MPKETNHTILHVDDDPDDLEMLQDAIGKLENKYRVIESSDGVDALQQLEELKKEGTLPCLIVLDINMPKLDGRQTFMAIKSDPELAKIPVVIFSTSSSPMDRMFFEHKHVEYMTKPILFQNFLDTAQRLLGYCQ
jgi:CheY-like chemotaxis protein